MGESSTGDSVNGQQCFEQGFQQLEIEGVGAVGFGVGRVVVDLEKEAINARRYRGAGKQGNELGLAAADSTGCRGLLHGVGAVKDYWGELAHDGKGAVVDDQRVVAEAGPTFGEEDALIAGGTHFFKRVSHVPRRHELALLDVYGTASFAGGYEEVSLAAEEGGNLEDVDSLGGGVAVGRLVNVGEYGEAGFAGDAAEDADAFGESRTTEALHAGAVGFVIAGLEDVGNAHIRGYALDGVCHEARVLFAFDDAGAGDEKELACADVYGSDFKRMAHEGDFNQPHAGTGKSRSPLYLD